jgi:polysaccharide biosynthesis protein PslH
VRHAVAVLYLREETEAPIDPDIESMCEWAESVARSHVGRASLVGRIGRRVRLVASLVTGRPIWVQAVDEPEFARAVRRAVREWAPDLVQLDYHVMGRYLNALAASDAPRVIVLYEAGADGAGRAADSPSRLLLALDRWAWTVYERRILRRVQCAVALTETDRERIARHAPEVRIETIGLGIEIPSRPTDPVGVPPPTALFVGNFRHTPNVEAAIRLGHDIWPLVRARHPHARLALVGDNPPAAVADLRQAEIDVVGGVPQVEPWLERAALCVAPLREGGGMRVKVLEALAAGKAVVASPLAVAGLAVKDGRELLVATSDEDFANAIVRVLDDVTLRRSLAAAAREWAVANVSIERTAGAFELLYEQLIERTR